MIIADGTMKASDFALKNGISMNIAGGTHHAFSNRAEAFCMLNDQAIGAKYIQNKGLVKKILIVDLDVHQGNGTAEIFQNDPSVFTFSMHGKSNYPFIKEKYKNFPAIKNFFKNKQLIRLIAVAEGSKVFNEIESFRFEKTIFGNPKGDTDNNIPFHADVHFHSHKVLFYTSNVTEDEGPFAYCLKSHNNDFDRLWFEFKRGQLKDSHKYSWRIEDHLDNKFFKNYFQKLMKNKYKVVGKPNTLIIANVHGFHQRGKALEGASRSLIRIPYRYNPLGPQKELSPDMYSGSLF